MKLYVILIKRTIDSEAWPAVYQSWERASLAYGRVSKVTEVEVEPETVSGDL